MSFALLSNATVCFSKLSVLLMYTALIPTPSMIKWAKGIDSLIVTWNLADIDFALPGTCGSQPKFYFAMGMINLVTDTAIIVLPMPYLFRLRMAMRRKLLAMELLSIGIGTWVITIYRQTLLPGLNFADMIYSGVLATILSGLEPAVAIALACIPLMRPLFGKKSTKTSDSGYNYESSKTSRIYSKKAGRDATNTFSELVDDNDDSSQVQVQPLKPALSLPSKPV
ncbi:hypothetical protein K458DRAFT_442819 [Lentithecium fluviatile CBS 122367]|uniref:Rhodopsin domain-containing protein n=1 Tax=Lentithecium fluviatile CBS 122367 TaxID=1168545 RepID=A0A6G1J1P8_9PLEO|nr:hypothetical protein K458DRAFT_442819 [Lentithecium fluviatile CBS 122367]